MAYPGQSDRAVILHRVTALDGPALLEVRLNMCADYGRASGARWHPERHYWLTETNEWNARWNGSPAVRVLSGPDGRGLQVELELNPGRPHDLVLEIQQRGFVDVPLPDADAAWTATESAWSTAVPTCDAIPAGRDVRRSFAVLRGMTDRHGATVAAATTSLPERAEAGRNYDYRYAWIRDTCYIGHAGAAVKGGEDLLDDAVRWVCERVLSDGPDTMPAYCVDGSPVPEPSRLGLPGYPGGSDIVGNEVRTQFQLDLFGEVLLLLANAASIDRLDADGWRAAELALCAIEQRSSERESGIWEVGPDHWTHSRLISVAGLRAIAEQPAPERWRTRALTLADSLLSEVDRTCLHRSGRWQRSPTDDRVDASLLLAEIRGALPAGDPRSVTTRQAVAAELCQDDYLYRYAHRDRTLGEDEGAFLICNFWMALAELRAGNTVSGAQWFERTRASCGSSGLFSEEYDVHQRQLRGNLPQAFVHALLIECAAELEHA
jgi:GH15 family glucan-1,4-alpha-glucosidase